MMVLCSHLVNGSGDDDGDGDSGSELSSRLLHGVRGKKLNAISKRVGARVCVCARVFLRVYVCV